MKMKFLIFAFMLLLPIVGSGQSTSSVFPTQAPVRSGFTLPATCTPNSKSRVLFYKFGASNGLYQCLATNTWTAVGGGGGIEVGVTTSDGVATHLLKTVGGVVVDTIATEDASGVLSATTLKSNTLDSGASITFRVGGGAIAQMSGSGQTTFKFPIAFGATETAPDVGIARSAAGIATVTDGSTGIRGFLGGGGSVASAAALPLPTGRVFHVTGTTNITSITSTNFQSGVCITLIFDGILTLTAGNNLKMAGNFTTTANDSWSGCYDGTNWFETSRVVITN